MELDIWTERAQEQIEFSKARKDKKRFEEGNKVTMSLNGSNINILMCFAINYDSLCLLQILTKGQDWKRHNVLFQEWWYNYIKETCGCRPWINCKNNWCKQVNNNMKNLILEIQLAKRMLVIMGVLSLTFWGS